MNNEEDVKNNMANDEYIDNSVKFKIKNGILQKYSGSASEVIIPDGVKVIGSRAFSGALDLEKVTIPEGVEVISDKAFEYCFLLREAILPHSLKKIGNRCFAICNIKELNHPLLKIENGLAIKDNSLLYCADSSLDNVIIPEGIEVINASAFDMCDAESVTIPNSVKSIEFFGFGGCTNLKSVKLPEGLKVIEAFAFAFCEELGPVIIPKSVESIGGDVFYRTNKFGNILKEQKCKNDSCGYDKCVKIYNSDGSLDIYNYEEPEDDFDNIYQREYIAHFKNEEAMKAAGWENISD